MPFEIKIDSRVQGLFLKDPERAATIFAEEFKKFYEEMTSLGLRKTVAGTPVFSGNLAGSEFREIRGSGLDLHGIIATPIIYARPIETGEFPSFPNVAGMHDWVRLQLGITDPKEIDKVTFLVARAIAQRKGFKKAHWMFRNAYIFLKQKAQGILNKAANRIIERWK